MLIILSFSLFQFIYSSFVESVRRAKFLKKKKNTLNFRIYRVLSSESNASSLRRKNRRSRRVIRIGWGEDCPLLFVCTINYSLFHYPYSSVTRKVWTKRERERERGRKKIIKQILLLFLQSIHVFHSNKLVRFVRATYKGVSQCLQKCVYPKLVK